MRVLEVSLRDFRSYEEARLRLGEGITLICGANGAGKTNLLEALYFGLTGRSCRTGNEREVVRFGAGTTRVTVATQGEDARHELSVGFQPGEPKRMRVDGAPVERLLDVAARPLVSVFLPDRLDLVKGAPTLRRGHLDAFVAALWPARVVNRRRYAQTLAQRNALLARVRAGQVGEAALLPWNAQLAVHGMALIADRHSAVSVLSDRFMRIADELGLEGEAELRYRPRSRAERTEDLERELEERTHGDLERGFTGHGPHRDDLALLRDGRELRTYGSQGQQRLALLALLLAEREALAERETGAPLILLDDVMSELDAVRRRALVSLLRAAGGQAVITATDVEHVPGAHDAGMTRMAVAGGRLLEEALAA